MEVDVFAWKQKGNPTIWVTSLAHGGVSLRPLGIGCRAGYRNKGAVQDGAGGEGG